MGLKNILILLALILFAVEAIWHRNLVAGGLALLTLTLLV